MLWTGVVAGPISTTEDVEGTIVGASRLRGMDAAGVFAAWTGAGGRFAAVRGRAEVKWRTRDLMKLLRDES